MYNFTRRAFVAGTAGALLVPLASCSSSGSGSGGGTLNVLTLQDPFFYAIQELLPEFEEKFDISVNFEGVDYDTLNSRATNSFTSQQSDIDVIAPDSMWLSRFAENGWLLPLNERIEEEPDEVQLEDFIPSSLHSLSEWKGNLHTLPVATYGNAVLYRPSVFEALGLELPPADPSEDWTWDAYLETIEAINGENVDGVDMFGTTVLGAGPQPITHMWAQVAASKGARWVKAYPDAPEWDFTPTFDSQQAIDSFDYYKALYDNSPPDSVNYVWFDAGTRFGSGDIGMMYHWTPYANLIQRTEYMGDTESSVVDDFAIATLPKEPGEDQIINIGGFAFGIGANSNNQDAAWEFVKWASSVETQKKMALLDSRQFSDFSRNSLYEDDELLEAYGHLPTQQKVIQQGDGKTARPPVQNYSTMEQIIGNALNRMIVEGTPAEEVSASIQTQLEDTLESENYIPWEGESYEDTLEKTGAVIDELSP